LQGEIPAFVQHKDSVGSRATSLKQQASLLQPFYTAGNLKE